jgi:SAM-dependent methyltransferase
MSAASLASPATCPVCHGQRTAVRWSQRPDRLFRATSGRFDLHGCADCRTAFVHPVPSGPELAAFYPETYWVGPTDREQGAGVPGGLLERYRRFVLRDHVRFTGKVVADQRAAGMAVRVLDVGCGDGSFLEALGVPGSLGMDLSKTALRAVRARGFGAVRGVLDDCPIRPGSCSLVTAFHFLEHVHPIEPVLASMRRLLAPGGEIVVQVPNADCLQAKILGRHWAGYDVPRHLVNYTARTLRQVVERCGFEVVAENQQCLRDNPTTLSNSLIPGLYPPSRMSRAGGHGGLLGALANMVYLGFTVASMPFSWFEAALGRGASVMLRARPRDGGR